MKRLILFFLSITTFCLSSVVHVHAENIKSFVSDITLYLDSSYQVQEKIVYDFGEKERHGIYRNIPYKYFRNGQNYNVRIGVEQVIDEQKNPYPYEVGQEEDVYIKIGDADTFVSGIHTYNIGYTVQRGINYFAEQDELYWNVTGNGWEIPIQEVMAKVMLPQEIDPQVLQIACYTGEYGSTNTDCSYTVHRDTIQFISKNVFRSGEGMTIVIGLPKGILQQPTGQQEIVWFLQDNWMIFVPFITLFVMLGVWWKKGKELYISRHIAPMYDAPHHMSPSEMGVIVDQKADNKDISSILISLAVRGFVKIKEIEKKVLFIKQKDYEFVKLKEADASLEQHEIQFLDGLFGVKKQIKLSDLKEVFYTTVQQVKSSLYALVAQHGYFARNPETVRGVYIGIGIAVTVVGMIMSGILQQAMGLISFFISGGIIMIFAFLMPRRTIKGQEAHRDILGFKLYLNRAEKKQLEFLNAPSKKPEIFEKYLPYAMVLGVEQAWAKEFKDIYTEPPSWYETQQWNTFNSLYLIQTLHHFSQVSTQTMTSTPSKAGSGGSGFSGGGSGGGFGGGGGGSW